MKTLQTIALAILLTVSAVSSAQQKKINVATSTINWVGKKVTGQHSGTLKIKEGIVVFNKKKLKGGLITVDMTSITATDLKAGEGKEDLEGHLKTEDFFGVVKYPMAKIDFKLIADNGDGSYNVTANLTIKDVTAPVTFKIVVNGNAASTNLKIDRTKYGIKYGSGSFFENLGDKTIADEFELAVALKF